MTKLRALWNYGKTPVFTEAEVAAIEAEYGPLLGEERAALLYGYTVRNAVVQGAILALVTFVLLIGGLFLWA
jgi:hypothetical protein